MKRRILTVILVLVVVVSAAMVLTSCGLFGDNEQDRRGKNSSPSNMDVTLTPTSITFVDKNNAYDLEVSVNGTDWQDDLTVTGLTPNTKYTAYARQKENNEYKAGDPWTKDVTTPKYSQDASNVTFEQADKTVTLSANVDLEYSFDGGENYVADNSFTYTSNGEKVIKVRYKETADKYAGEEQIINVNISDFYAGFGTETDPYLIKTIEHFNALPSESAHKSYKLISDITFTSPITTTKSLAQDTFNGNGYSLINPVAVRGIFSYVGMVKNLTVENAEITFEANGSNGYNVGIIAGIAQVIENCKVSGSITVTNNSGELSSQGNIGGLVGRIRSSILYEDTYYIKNSSADVDIQYTAADNTRGSIYVGGLFGYDEASVRLTVSESFADIDFDLTGTYDGNIGGIAGAMIGSIDNCYATGTMVVDGYTPAGNKGTLYVGGLVSVLNGGMDSCYADVNIGVDGTDQVAYAGGVVARYSSPGAQMVKNCFFSGNVYATDGLSDGFSAFGIPTWYTIQNCYLGDHLTTDKSGLTLVPETTMQIAAWQRDMLLFSADVWDFVDNGYPTLK